MNRAAPNQAPPRLRWLLMPCVVAVLAWGLLVVPETMQRVTPSIIYKYSETRGTASLRDTLPPVPESLGQAYALGELHEQLLAAERANSSSAAAAILDKAASLLDRKTNITAAQLHGVAEHLRAIEEQQGVVSRAMGFLNFVNVMWLLAILGISVSVGPVLVMLLRPLWSLISAVLALISTAFFEFIYPILQAVAYFVHYNGIDEICAYLLSWTVVVDGTRFQPETGLFISIMGIALLFSCLAYTIAFYRGGLTGTNGNASERSRTKQTVLLNLWSMSLTAPLAIHFHSVLFGFAAVASLYSALGFGVVPIGLGLVIGFNGKDALLRVLACSTIMLTVQISFAMSSGRARGAFAPFAPATSILGAVTFYLALLIASSRYSKFPYAELNMAMITTLVAGVFFGFVYGVPGLANTAIVFVVLYGLEKSVEVMASLGANIWFFVFGGSVVLFKIALWLHTHPEFLVAIVAPDPPASASIAA
eukprot:m.4612 g.4612  ORF g.4612 m.4612 type:complete len:478 (+) comp2435_c0_seq1:2-1435(+)